MKKKALIAIVLVIILSVTSYVQIGKIIIHNKMEAYLENKGYKESEVKSIDVYHSFLNKVLSYDEWYIHVRYNDESNVIYIYAFKKGNILPSGVTGIPDGKMFKHGDPEPFLFKE